MELDIARLILATRDGRLVELWRHLCHNNADVIQTRNKERGSLVIEDLFGGPGAYQTDALERQWACVVEARRKTSMEEAFGTWMRIVAVANDDCVPLLLQQHFGRPGSSGLTRQQVAEREMALEVAAFLQAPLARASEAKSWAFLGSFASAGADDYVSANDDLAGIKYWRRQVRWRNQV
ncbi:hypothetical protein GGI19_002539 [Coemansia pectinata]|uniref:Uncharacterized protein n=1 Tax=Coemansia pectinata TaxID=1052879 RepID=A0A9W8LBT2_9FUNG|nr:hypothetical protein GGI19_002539 [Coemansia pectinata]